MSHAYLNIELGHLTPGSSGSSRWSIEFNIDTSSLGRCGLIVIETKR